MVGGHPPWFPIVVHSTSSQLELSSPVTFFAGNVLIAYHAYRFSLMESLYELLFY